MNEVFLMGKIITEIKFDFLLNSKKKSIARFYIETLGKQKIKIVAHCKCNVRASKNAGQAFSAQ